MALRDLDRCEQLAVEPLVERRDLGIHGGLLLLGLVGLLRVRTLLGDLEPLDAPLPDAEEGLVVVGLRERAGELVVHRLVVLLDLVGIEDAEHLLHDVRGIDLAVARARLDLDAVEVLAHLRLEPLDHPLAEQVVAAADFDNLRTFDALRRGALDELLVLVDLIHDDLRLAVDAFQRAVREQHPVLLLLAGVELDVVPRDAAVDVLVDTEFGWG